MMVRMLLEAQDIESARFLLKKVLSLMSNLDPFERQIYSLILNDEREEALTVLKNNPERNVQDLCGMHLHLIWMAFVNKVGDSDTLDVILKHIQRVVVPSYIPFLNKFNSSDPKVIIEWMNRIFDPKEIYFENFDLEFLKVLKKKGFDFGSALGEKYIRNAIESGKADCLDWLLNEQRNCDEEQFDRYFLMVFETKNNDLKIRRIFQAHPRTDIHARSEKGYSALFFSSRLQYEGLCAMACSL